LARRLSDFGQAEVSQQSPPTGYEDVVRFDIAVNDSPLVSVIERVSDLNDIINQVLQRSAALDQVPQRPGIFHVAHDQVAVAVMHAKVVHFQDVGMVQTGGRVRFSFEAFGEARFLGQGRGQDLDRHKTVQARLVSLKHPGHAALSYLLFDFVLAKRLTNEIIHSLPQLLRSSSYQPTGYA
jgi:hypothetical protein